jgi:predicted nucleotidyltransferase
MFTQADIEAKLKRIKPILSERYHVSSIGYFGSFSNNLQSELSDLDLLVEFSRPIGWDFFKLEQFLEQSLGLKVDLVTRNALKDRVKESILNQVKYI